MRSRNFLLKIARSKFEVGAIISPIFLREKSNGSFGLILNLKKLNGNIERNISKWKQEHQA